MFGVGLNEKVRMLKTKLSYLSTTFLIAVATVLFAQATDRNRSDFLTLQKESLDELQLKTEGHMKTWGLDKIERWDLSQDSGELMFTLPGGLKAVSPAQIIGTYNSDDHTWLWAWANSSIDEKLQVDSLKLRKYGEEHHINRLTTAKWVGNEDDAWAMVALAVKLCREEGAYRGPAGGATYAFIAFGQVKVRKE